MAGAAVILVLIDPFFHGGDWYKREYIAYRDGRIAGIEVEEPGQIDLINVGDSLANVGIAPMELFRDYGITSYTMGRDEQKPAETYYAIRKAMRYQNVKVRSSSGKRTISRCIKRIWSRIRLSSRSSSNFISRFSNTIIYGEM